MKQNLKQAYLEAEYVIFSNKFQDKKIKTLDKEIIFKVEQFNAYLNDFLKENKANNFIFITAYNPESNKKTELENIIKQKELINEVKSLNYNFFYGEGRDIKSIWEAEKSIIILDIKEKDIEYLINKYSQNAIVKGEINNTTYLYYKKNL